jgi:hypothetical protein
MYPKYALIKTRPVTFAVRGKGDRADRMETLTATPA